MDIDVPETLQDPQHDEFNTSLELNTPIKRIKQLSLNSPPHLYPDESNDIFNQMMNRGYSRTLSNKVLTELNSRAKEISAKIPSPPSQALSSKRALERKKRYSGIHRLNFSKMESISNHYAASRHAGRIPLAYSPVKTDFCRSENVSEVESTPHHDTGKRNSTIDISSVQKRRRTLNGPEEVLNFQLSQESPTKCTNMKLSPVKLDLPATFTPNDHPIENIARLSPVPIQSVPPVEDITRLSPVSIHSTPPVEMDISNSEKLSPVQLDDIDCFDSPERPKPRSFSPIRLSPTKNTSPRLSPLRISPSKGSMNLHGLLHDNIDLKLINDNKENKHKDFRPQREFLKPALPLKIRPSSLEMAGVRGLNKKSSIPTLQQKPSIPTLQPKPSISSLQHKTIPTLQSKTSIPNLQKTSSLQPKQTNLNKKPSTYNLPTQSSLSMQKKPSMTSLSTKPSVSSLHTLSKKSSIPTLNKKPSMHSLNHKPSIDDLRQKSSIPTISKKPSMSEMALPTRSSWSSTSISSQKSYTRPQPFSLYNKPTISSSQKSVNADKSDVSSQKSLNKFQRFKSRFH